MYQVMKRDGQIAKFDLSKICVAIEKAFHAQEKDYNQDIIDLLALKVTADFEPKIKDGLIQVEDIQDSVESILIQGRICRRGKRIYSVSVSRREKIRNHEIHQCWITKKLWITT